MIMLGHLSIHHLLLTSNTVHLHVHPHQRNTYCTQCGIPTMLAECLSLLFVQYTVCICTYVHMYMCAHTYMCTVCMYVTLVTRKCTNIAHVYCMCVFKSSSQDTTDDHKWIICDGPVDALWIENMNTVLDDNKMLCLANSERIKLNNTMHMVFEVQDLAVASPATVSRYSYSQVHTEAVWGEQP